MRKLGNSNLEVSAIGFGCMGLNFGYAHPLSKEESITLICQAVDRGVTFFDTAEIYGPFTNEGIVPRRNEDLKGAIIMTVKAILLTILTMIVTCLNADAQTPPSQKKILVAYFSQSGNTREIALQIQEATGGEVFEIVPANPYPTDNNAMVKQAKQEQKKGLGPPLKAKVSNIDSYDVVFVGSPNWWGTIAPPVMTFLSSYNLSGKTIVPFITHGGSRMGRSVQDVKRLSPGAKVLDGQAFRGRDVKDARTDVRKWVNDMNLMK